MDQDGLKVDYLTRCEDVWGVPRCRHLGTPGDRIGLDGRKRVVMTWNDPAGIQKVGGPDGSFYPHGKAISYRKDGYVNVKILPHPFHLGKGARISRDIEAGSASFDHETAGISSVRTIRKRRGVASPRVGDTAPPQIH